MAQKTYLKKIKQYESVNITLEINKAQKDSTVTLFAYLTDNHLNVFNQVGFTDIPAGEGLTKIPMQLKFGSEVTSQKIYSLIFCTSEKPDVNDAATLSLPDIFGTTYSKAIDILNPEWNVADKIILTETIDVTAIRLVDFVYDINVKFKTLDGNSIATGPTVLVVDDDGNILSKASNNLSTPTPGEYNVSLTLRTPSIYKDMNVKIFVAFINRTGEFPGADFLIPVLMDGSVINPVSVQLYTWNRYDYFRLTKSIETKKTIFNPNEKLELSSAITLEQEDPENLLFLYTLNILLRDVNGKTYNISKTPGFYNKANAPVDINVECQIPASLTAGVYKMFIYIDELFNANGEPGEYVKGQTLDIVDNVDITIL